MWQFCPHIYVNHVHIWCPWRPQEGIRHSETGVMDSGELPCGYWELDLWTRETPLQPLRVYLLLELACPPHSFYPSLFLSLNRMLPTKTFFLTKGQDQWSHVTMDKNHETKQTFPHLGCFFKHPVTVMKVADSSNCVLRHWCDETGWSHAGCVGGIVWVHLLWRSLYQCLLLSPTRQLLPLGHEAAISKRRKECYF